LHLTETLSNVLEISAGVYGHYGCFSLTLLSTPLPVFFLLPNVRGMLWDLVKFSGLYGLVLMGFSLAYYVLLHDTAPHSYGLLRKVRDSLVVESNCSLVNQSACPASHTLKLCFLGHLNRFYR
jgi:hypothetical protein